MKSLFKNWQTTAPGIIALAGSVLGLIRGIQLNDDTIIIGSFTMIVNSIGNIFSKAQNVTGVGADAMTTKEIKKEIATENIKQDER